MSNTERFGRDFSLIIPVTADTQTGYRLPDAVRTKIAEEIIKKAP
jgi:hypothetical protein